ncbi:hypothetical protein [Nitrospira sp. Kam-Ns4a]
MSPVFKSGAFVQQCFSVHPRCLVLKKLALPERLILACTSCNLQHRLTLRALASRSPAAHAPHEGTPPVAVERAAEDWIAHCATAHQTALGVREMDVLRDFVGLRCAECRRLYDLDVAFFETHQP